MLRKFTLTLIFLMLLILQAACARGPAQDDVKTAIRARLSDQLPASWVVKNKNGFSEFAANAGLVKAADIQIDNVNIEQRGPYQEEGKYWPIKVRIAGSFRREVVGNKGDRVAFEHEGDFRFSKDDYGNWQAVMVEQK